MKDRGLEILFLNQEDIKRLITIEDAIKFVSFAFKMHAKKMVQMPPKIYLNYTKYKGDLRAMPAYIVPLNASGVKIVNVHTENNKLGLPTVMAVFVLVSPKTGAPLAVMDATYITDLRTGAAGAIATKALARKNSKTLGLVGAGKQAKLQLLAISKVVNIREVRVCGKTKDESLSFVREMKGTLNIPLLPAQLADVCSSDIVSTTTPVRSPIVKNKWIKPGTHINAIGADAPGKQELEVEILQRARIFVDDMEQAIHSGEVNVAISKGAITREFIAGEIGEVLAGIKAGRRGDKEITIFDSTGLAIQDVALAHTAYKKAKLARIGKLLRLF